MCINEGSSATDYTLIGEFKFLLISRFVLKNDLMAPDVLMWLIVVKVEWMLDESKESKSLVYITHVLCCKVAWAFFPREEKL